jgi:hypothetical protein
LGVSLGCPCTCACHVHRGTRRGAGGQCKCGQCGQRGGGGQERARGWRRRAAGGGEAAKARAQEGKRGGGSAWAPQVPAVWHQGYNAGGAAGPDRPSWHPVRKDLEGAQQGHGYLLAQGQGVIPQGVGAPNPLPPCACAPCLAGAVADVLYTGRDASACSTASRSTGAR